MTPKDDEDNYTREEKETVIVVEDSDYLNNFIASNLRKHNYDVIQCFNKKDAIENLKNNLASCVVLDLNLGNDENGMSILRQIRLQNKMLPVLIVSSISDNNTKIEGFREGCDDYITKPFYIDELMMRIDRMISKFSLMGFEKKAVSSVYKSGIFELDMENCQLKKNGQPIRMRKKQLELMLYFIQNPNKILPLKSIYQNVWNEPIPDEKTLESNVYTNIRALRLLIEEDKKTPQHIVSVSKSGYIFVPN
ncbi:MAG: response regulator transcription factor [Treponemataceae bacterium]|nr:response regulator transcription factor [Treponemataceae bacterium]